MPDGRAGTGLGVALIAALVIGAAPLSTAITGTPIAAAADTAAEDTAVLVTASGRHTFRIEIAETPEQRARGLMHRTGLAADYGMLFDFGADRPVAFWMKNTPTALDMVFIRGDGVVAGIAEDTTPFSLESIASPAPVRFVLEVVAGTARRIGLKPGDRMEQPRVGG